MPLPGYIALVSVAYGLSFFGVFVLLGDWPAYSPLVASIMVIAASLVMSWSGTLRMQRIWPTSERPLFAPTLCHAVVITAMWLCAFAVLLEGLQN